MDLDLVVGGMHTAQSQNEGDGAVHFCGRESKPCSAEYGRRNLRLALSRRPSISSLAGSPLLPSKSNICHGTMQAIGPKALEMLSIDYELTEEET